MPGPGARPARPGRGDELSDAGRLNELGSLRGSGTLGSTGRFGKASEPGDGRTTSCRRPGQVLGPREHGVEPSG